ncbi:arginyl-tRNA synthetase, cytoplasmic, putative [Entamoeba invadens IP1]|uniref:arginyl-tRNA synthetase, cytoplasmic, putative n=1 Tax=Entamoeba invadens IP1 TaxID=370355 RepID=UPI0002C3F098|nr:arginyl-tRNA synthetase, cytoplasmic, putative [Entamoeba invadens IP1]ELP85100.1 arginyl-tRNA synthetase, cytoplasmic, putative [Entamoeba invadens IP1]|eukprot:XP_004184446.1 arginyl-tRNA synthetase, cytoplasmic, putative [Entamoeba invadens IP1]
MLAPFKVAIAKVVSEAASIPEDFAEKSVELCKKKESGDFSVPIPRIIRQMTTQEKNPSKVAEELAKKIAPNDFISKVTVTGPFINFSINKSALAKTIISQVFNEKEHFGGSKMGDGQKVVVEFSSPNIAKPFHAGHLRSTIIGNFIANVHRLLGFDVISMNWLGDWGSQFGLLAIGFEKYGSQEELEKNPIRHLYDVYVKINADKKADDNVRAQGKDFFKHMEQGDEEYLAKWKLFKKLSLEELKRVYKRLNVTFDVFTGESETDWALVDETVKELEVKGISKMDKGCLVVDLEKYKLGVALLKKDDGSTLYLTRDIASAIKRYRTYNFSKSYYVVASQQNLHFKQLFKILELLGYSWAKNCYHISFGMVMGMSTRRGTAVFLQDILDDASATMLETMQKNTDKLSEIKTEDQAAIADKIGVSAVFVQDYNAKRIKDYQYNRERMTSFEGYTGPYLQYAHARCCGVERKAGLPIPTLDEVDFTLLNEPEAEALVLAIAKYGDVIMNTYNNLEPNTLVTYLFELSHVIASAHSVLRVKGSEEKLAKSRLMLLHCARVVLGNGLRLLGLEPLEKM